MRIIGLTGGIGSGKSTVAEMLRELGALVIDADEAARAVVEPGQPALAEIVAEFGEGVLGPGGRLDRRAVAQRVFDDEEARGRLNRVVHPRIGEWMGARIAEAAGRGIEVVVTDTPLLYETGLDAGVAETVVVWVPLEMQVARAVARGMEELDVRARVAAQLSLDDKRGWATHVIDNSGTREETRRQVVRLWPELRRRAAGQP
ncbi:MAG: dephospho-CoA kinase [Candidatus Dormibacteraeota bacterium]|nr:dephospho-CoA kinase [Candidatus Dormibacteraeota bacterium]